jgi:hypothetical protein
MLQANTRAGLVAQFSSILRDVYGVIETIEGSEIFAFIYSHDGECLESVTFEKHEFPHDDLPLVEANNVFYWVVGEQEIAGKKVPASEFRIRRFS